MKTIPLTQGKVALVDDEDYEEVSKWGWSAAKAGNTYYAVRTPPPDLVTGTKHTIRMHAVIAGTPKGMQTDHINGNGLDNCRRNLMIVTRRQNLQNMHIKKSSRFPGVSWDIQTHKWRSYIWFNGKLRALGRHRNEEQAALRYRVACDWQVIDL